jgi:hypothetical protein
MASSPPIPVSRVQRGLTCLLPAGTFVSVWPSLQVSGLQRYSSQLAGGLSACVHSPAF